MRLSPGTMLGKVGSIIRKDTAVSWQCHSSEHAALNDIITKIQASSTAYHAALDMSIMMAKAGYAFCKDAEDLCKYLVDPDISVVDLQKYINEMKDKVRQAHLDATSMTQSFRSVQQSLFGVRMAKFYVQEIC